MGSRFDDADYQLRWPRSVFVAEAARLLNHRDTTDWDSRCEQFLEDAFVGGISGGPLDEFREIPAFKTSDPWDSAATVLAATVNKLTERQTFLRRLMDGADQLKEDSGHRKPYWSQRKTGVRSLPVRQTVLAGQFVALVGELDELGYFEKRFGTDCVDDPSPIEPSAVIEHEIGVGGLWPLRAGRLSEDLDLLCDVVEVLHDLVARPVERRYHNYGECGWHHSNFSIETGRTIYRWRVNRLLERSDIGLRLADSGEDVGRLVGVTDEARSELVDVVLARGDSEVGDQIRHAIALFRARGADKHQKRSAIIALAGVLEERRKVIKAEMLSKDEDALFAIANNFSIRHQNQSQRNDYDPAFLDWVFWWYLATIELTDRIEEKHNVPSPTATPA